MTSPPLPPAPWVLRDSVDRDVPFSVDQVPFINQGNRDFLTKNFVSQKQPKAMSIHSGRYSYYYGQQSQDEAVRARWSSAAAMRRVLHGAERGRRAVVPLPKTMKIVGLLSPDTINGVSADLRNETVRRIRAQGGWSALATGAGGRPGIAIRAADETAAVLRAMADCERVRIANAR